MEERIGLWIVGIVAIVGITFMVISSTGTAKASSTSAGASSNTAGQAAQVSPEACYSRCLDITSGGSTTQTDINFCANRCGLRA